MNTSLNISGILCRWQMFPNTHYLSAQVVYDFSGGFTVGEFITTSPVVSIEVIGLFDNQLRIARTKNSIYVLL